MNAKMACVEWARLLRAVADGEVSPAEALARRPVVGESAEVPNAWGSGVVELERECGDPTDDVPEAQEYWANRVRKVAGRLERYGRE